MPARRTLSRDSSSIRSRWRGHPWLILLACLSCLLIVLISTVTLLSASASAARHRLSDAVARLLRIPEQTTPPAADTSVLHPGDAALADTAEELTASVLTSNAALHLGDAAPVDTAAAIRDKRGRGLPAGTWAPRVTKHHESARVRFLFFAGVEGTGHHAWQEAWQSKGKLLIVAANAAKATEEALKAMENEAPSDGNEPITVALASKRLQKHLLSNQHQRQPNVFYPSSAQHLAEATRVVQEEVRAFLSLEKLLNRRRRVAVVMNTAFEDEHSGFLSYPSFGGPNKNLKMPDVETLANIVDGVGGDLRIIAILRTASLAVSSGIRRNFHRLLEGCGPYERPGPFRRPPSHHPTPLDQRKEVRCEMLYVNTLTQGQRLLAEQLRALDRKFWTCNHTETPHDHERIVQARVSEDLFENIDVATATLRSITEDIFANCPPTPRDEHFLVN